VPTTAWRLRDLDALTEVTNELDPSDDKDGLSIDMTMTCGHELGFTTVDV